MSIDWSNPPEWADRVCRNSLGSLMWVGQGNYQYCNKEAAIHPLGEPGCYAEADILVASVRPPWTGEGLPPVGAICEASVAHAWITGEIVAHFDGRAVAVMANKESVFLMEPHELRPILTPEQIAAVERDDAVAAIMEVMPLVGSARAICAALYDAGWRRIHDA